LETEHPIWTEGDPPEPVSVVPLEGFELTVLKVWLKNSPRLQRAYQNPDNREPIGLNEDEKGAVRVVLKLHQ
jgi:hypothetical protein